MNCESGAILGGRERASGECSGHILIFEHFHEIRICYVFHGQSVTRVSCDQKSIVFIVSDCNNRTATAGFLLPPPIKPLQESRKDASEHGFGACAFFLTNISSRAPRAIGMTVSDGDG